MESTILSVLTVQTNSSCDLSDSDSEPRQKETEMNRLKQTDQFEYSATRSIHFKASWLRQSAEMTRADWFV